MSERSVTRLRQFIQDAIWEKRTVHTMQSVQEALQDLFQLSNNLRQLWEGTPAGERFGIVDNSLTAKHAFALGIEFDGQFTKGSLPVSRR